ncbi:FAD-dependent oxidoreductase [Luteimonas sp. Y-2-2-4F]|nr:FAD-dependent oxidoreductase [Luteimonas sp. Y-2-2-4F]MCD9030265.1 FAD-dependent oxidoreductase [Luteimonas sp. Y-2-2-4F]
METIPRPRLLDEARAIPSRLGPAGGAWSWHSAHRPGAPAPANWYEASLDEAPAFAPLAGDGACEVVVIGGGLLGASTALHLAEAGVDTVLLERDGLGAAASGRNGGQLTPGLARWEAADMLARLPFDEARRLWRFASAESMALIDAILARYGLDVDRRRGHITAAVHPGHLGALVEDADARLRLGDGEAWVVGRHALREHLRSPLYHGATIDGLGGQLHPLALVRGLAHGFARHGGRAHERTEVLAVAPGPGGTVVRTRHGRLLARRGVVLAVHEGSARFLPRAAATTVPFHTYVGVTPPLDVDSAELLPTGLPVYDTRFQIDYYRPVHGNRLLFGGQGTGTRWAPERVNRYLLGRIRAVFPQLQAPALEFSWSGTSDFTLNGATECRKSDDAAPVYLAHGWSGHGVAQTVRIGKAIADDLTGRNDDFAMLTRIPHRAIPMGRRLAPAAIPLAKAAAAVAGAVRPDRLVSF